VIDTAIPFSNDTSLLVLLMVQTVGWKIGLTSGHLSV